MNYTHGVFHFFFTMVIYLGLPLAGWGLTDLRGFFANPARLGFAVIIGIGALLAVYQGMVIPEERGEEDKRVGRQTVFFVVFGLLGMALLALMPYCDRRGIAVLPENQALRYLGLVLAAIGGDVAFISVLHLGRQYSPEVTIQENHRLVTSGLYRYIRHPRYLGLLIMIAGLALVFRAWTGLAADLVLLAALLWRISDEEKMLHQEFGETWEAYCQRTWRLVPGLW